MSSVDSEQRSAQQLSSADIAYTLLPGWSQYIPHSPWPKQLAFCMLPHREALYGGAAGGGKSDAMLMAALQFVDVPNYSAIIFRLALKDLQQNEGLLTRAQEWLLPYPEIRYIPSLHTFVFPSGARLAFGYIGNYGAWMHYQGSAYQFIGWDELTQHSEVYYKEMISRLRRLECKQHGGRILDGKRAPLPDDPNCEQCRMYGPLSRVPLRVRATANPGGPGHLWVKKRWVIHKDKATSQWVSGVKERPFIPANFMDNPALDQETYGRSLDELDDWRREQLKHGDWDKVANGRYKLEWFRNYEYRGGYYTFIDPTTGALAESFHESVLTIFTIVDIACSVRTGVAGEKFYERQPEASWTAIGTFGITPGRNRKLIVLDIHRFQEESPELFPALKKNIQKWKPAFVGMDANGPGKPLAQLAVQHGIPVKELITHHDKIANSVESQSHARAGRIAVPLASEWVDDFLGELSCWTGHPNEIDDQVDVLSNAGHEFTIVAGNQFRDVVYSSHVSSTPILQSKHGQILFEQDLHAAQGDYGLNSFGYNPNPPPGPLW